MNSDYEVAEVQLRMLNRRQQKIYDKIVEMSIENRNRSTFIPEMEVAYKRVLYVATEQTKSYLLHNRKLRYYARKKRNRYIDAVSYPFEVARFRCAS